MNTREVIETYRENLCAGRFTEAFEMFADDAVYTITGNTPISRVFNGRNEILVDLVEIISAYFKSVPKFIIHDTLVDGDRGVILAENEAEGTHGVYRQRFAFYLVVKDGKISRKVEYVDSLPIETALMGKKLVEA